MAIGGGVYALGVAAGALSTLSPCVLPLLPIVVGTSLNAHRGGALALAAGLALSFAAIGVFVATIGFGLGLGNEVFHVAAGLLMGAFGAVLLSARLRSGFAAALAGVETRIGGVLTGVRGHGLGGQFVVGLLLGAVWSPCSGPTLGSAALLASRQSHLPQVALTMLAFGIGAALPLLLVGTLSREVLGRWRGRLHRAGQGGNTAMGVVLLTVALLVLTGTDKTLEAAFVAHAPDWLVNVSGLV